MVCPHVKAIYTNYPWLIATDKQSSGSPVEGRKGARERNIA